MVMLTSTGFFFKEANLCLSLLVLVHVWGDAVTCSRIVNLVKTVKTGKMGEGRGASRIDLCGYGPVNMKG